MQQSVCFEEKILTQGNLGRILQERRELFGLERDDAATALNMSSRTVCALEENRFEDIPERLYRELFLKTYATYLGFSWSDLASVYARQDALYHGTPDDSAPVRPRTAVAKKHLVVAGRVLKNSLIVSGVAACALYLALLGFSLVRPPELSVLSPLDHTSTHTGRVRIEGATSKDATVAINGSPVKRAADGTFRQDIVLMEGANTIRVVAAKKYSKEHMVTRTVFFTKSVVENALPLTGL